MRLALLLLLLLLVLLLLMVVVVELLNGLKGLEPRVAFGRGMHCSPSKFPCVAAAAVVGGGDGCGHVGARSVIIVCIVGVCILLLLQTAS